MYESLNYYMKMKRILGLDLGSASIGWAVIEEYSKEVVSDQDIVLTDKIVAIGSRIIPLTVDESTQFSKGQTLTKNADRTKARTQRKGYDRYQLRRSLLVEKLTELGMYNGTTLNLSKLDLWGIRAKAVTEKLSLLEIGRVLCHLNQKRGYRTAKSDFGDKVKSGYVQQVVGRYRELIEKGLTIGQFMYEELKKDFSFRCKERIYPRDAYVEEYDLIMKCQKLHYPEVLTDEVIAYIRNYIIFHQRPLKSCKHLVGKCELERHDQNVNGIVRNCGPKVAPTSSPLFQMCKIWESINNLNIRNKNNDILFISLEQKQAIFDFMNKNEKLKATNLKNLLGLKTNEWLIGTSVGSGLQGNTTYCAISKALGNLSNKEELLRFDLKDINSTVIDKETGEIREVKIIDESFEKEPLYKLWHILYSVSDIETLHKILREKLNITDEAVIEALSKIDFVKQGYCNKSSRAMRKILPYLQDGTQYHYAIVAAYGDKPQNKVLELAERLLPIQKGELRQPVVEKILNQLVNVVNALLTEYGKFDEIRVELARELKQNREERESATKSINQNQKKNEEIATRIKTEYDLIPTRSRIQKYKMWEETNHICMYCGNPVNVAEFLLGSGVEVEHIIPRELVFDDSFSNKVCACHNCNSAKRNTTAYDFMSTKKDSDFEAYLERVNKLFEDKKISKTKRDNLLTPATELSHDFIERQLRESQYIAKKAKEMLQSICENVYSTTGNITDFLRHIWGWDNVLHSLNFEKYRNAGFTELVEKDVNGKKIKEERITEWSKRMDHRHHAIDALTIACTKQGYIQRINNLNSLKEVSFKSFNSEEQDKKTRQRLTRLERYIQMQPHFTTAEVMKAVENIAVSFKGGKRAASVGKRYVFKKGKRVCVQKGIIIPRGALSEESVYGRICNSETGKREVVIKYKLEQIALKDVGSIVDKRIREIVRERLEQFGGNAKNAFAEPLLDHQGCEIRSVRCYTGLKSTVPIRYNKNGEPISFVKPGNNHHVAIYEDEKGNKQEHIVTFWHAVERKKYGVPVIIQDLAKLWDNLDDNLPESFMEQLPPSATWNFKFSMQQNEMFILGMDENDYQEAMNNGDNATLSKYLYRVQKLAKGNYCFRHHLETSVDDKYNGVKNEMLSKAMKKLIIIQSLGALEKLNIHKVHVSVIGKITEI